MGRIPWLLLLAWLGIARSEELAGGSGRFLVQQIAWSAFAAAGLVAVALCDFRRLLPWSYALLAAAMALLVAVYFFPTINGAHRWIRLGPVGFQPSELAKPAFILAAAHYLAERKNLRTLPGVLLPLLLTLVPMLLILKEPDLGTALLFPPLLAAMLLAAGARWRHLAAVAAVAVMLTPLVWSQMSREQKSRVAALAEDTGPGAKISADAYHLHRARATLAVGGIAGTWLAAESPPPHTYLVPEPHTDSIAVVIAERLGLAGLGLLLLLYLVLVLRGLAVAAAVQHAAGRLVVVGITAWIGMQAAINTGMMVGLLPITGLSLPLCSYGGSSLLAVGLALGLVVSIARRDELSLEGEPFRYTPD